MNNLSNLKPEKVFEFFSQIAEIPHGSGNTEQIAQFCLDFAKERNLKAVRDKGGNVIIYADGTEGYENSEPVIIQGHFDMVCEKTADCTKDMTKEGITLCTDGEYVWADRTTLGGDDGIAMAYIFALLDSDDIPHPPIEAVITRDEETGMFGAVDFEPHLVKGRKMLNIDSEDEGILTVSCAGGISAYCEIPYSMSDEKSAYNYEISVSGLTGGHSGADIHLGRQNAIKVLAELLEKISDIVNFRISTVNGGGKANVIPQNASAIISTDNDAAEAISNAVSEFEKNFLEKYSETDPSACFTIKAADTSESFADSESTAKIIRFLNGALNGIQCMSKNMADMVQTSLNFGILTVKQGKICADFLIRSSVTDEKHSTAKKVSDFAAEFSGTTTLSGDYPGWEYREESQLRDIMCSAFEDMYGKAPKVSAIHAGLECGIFSEKLPGADIVSFGPNLENIHTPKERMNVASVERTWEYLKEILKRCK